MRVVVVTTVVFMREVAKNNYGYVTESKVLIW